jgi:mannose-6-phosphate isomerase-like protein (cupin superfamily)
MRIIKIPMEFLWASPGSYYDIAALSAYYLRVAVLEGAEHPKRAIRDTYFLCIYGSFEMLVKGKAVKMEQGDLLEVNQGEEYAYNSKERALVLVLEP